LDKQLVQSLKGVGPAFATKLEKVGIKTLQDVLFHLPLRYEDRTSITLIKNVQLSSYVVLEGNVVSCNVTFGRRRSLVVNLEDDTGSIALRFFHFSKTQQQGLEHASFLRCFGEVRRGAGGFEIYHPEYSPKKTPLTDTLTPIYPLTEGITQNRIRNLAKQVLELMEQGRVLPILGAQFPELSNPDLNEAISLVHNPPKEVTLSQLEDGVHPAQQRLAFEEMLAHHISMRLSRKEMLGLKSIAHQAPSEQYKSLRQQFGFELTNAQNKVAIEIEKDMQKPVPMLRLVQGDVGSGKTVVAALAAIHAVENNQQSAIMAPTEILAEQHLLNFTNWFAPLGLKIAWLSGKVKGKKREEQLELISSGEANIIIGTHALFQKQVNFKQLGLVIIDEQHRFGVHQRLALREKGEREGLLPHQLVMTATPIPRTLTMSLYADMDSSIIDELPPGRTPITTTVITDNRRDEIIEHVESACRNGTQAYWVCTLIDESEVLQCQAAESTYEQLKLLLPNITTGLIHGRMAAIEKSTIMSDFKKGNIQLLIATTVIEVGVDVPNASLMVIENAERLGLSQLHQLRGRIGRGTAKSFCVLLYHAPLGDVSRQRLAVMRESQDGFFIAEKDLEIRGPGELFGARQSGALQFRIADLLRDKHMLSRIRSLSDELLNQDERTARLILDRWLGPSEKLARV
jgi:ATP-dependent DNA helicase RecG